MRRFASLDLSDQSAPRLGEVTEEIIVPEMTRCIRICRALPRPDGDEYPDGAAGVFVQRHFVQCDGRGVEAAVAFVDEDALSDLDRLEG